MSNQLPAHLQSKTYAPIAERAIANIGQAAPPSLSIEGNRFTLIDAIGNEMPIQTLFLDANIVDVGDHTSKIFYDTDYAGKGQAMGPPPCWSDNGIGPSRNASSPQAPTCASCPKNEWGSATSKMTGKGIKACRDYEKIAIVPIGMQMVFLLRLPPNSRNHWRDYLKVFKGGVDVSDVITRIEFEQGVQGTIMFSLVPMPNGGVGYLPPGPPTDFRNHLRAENATDDIVGRLDQPRDPRSAPHLPSSAPEVHSHLTTTGYYPPNQPAPQAQPTIQFQGQPAQPVTLPSQGQTGTFAASAPAAEPPKRRRRTAAETVPAADPRQMEAFQTPGAGPGPVFSQPAATAPAAPFRPASAAPAQPSTFGIQTGVAPNAEVTAVLDGIFKK